MKKNRLMVLTIISLLLTALLGYYGGWWEGITQKPVLLGEKLVRPRETAEITVYKTRLVGWEGRQKTWEIEADRIWQATGGGVIYFEEITNGLIYSVRGERVPFKAGWARWEKWRRMLLIGGGLEAEIDGKIFTTAEIAMSYNEQELRCDRGIKVNGPDLTIKAGSMRLDLEKEEMNLGGGVELAQKSDRITAKGIKYSLKNEEFELIIPKGVTLSL